MAEETRQGLVQVVLPFIKIHSPENADCNLYVPSSKKARINARGNVMRQLAATTGRMLAEGSEMG